MKMFNDRFENPAAAHKSFKELQAQAEQLEKDGHVKAAATKFEEAGFGFKAIKLLREAGRHEEAYAVAVRTGENFEADRIALEFNIPGHEFSDFQPVAGGMVEGMKRALASRLQEGATAEKLGFSGFDGKVVVDVGTRDGRFVSLFKELGAKEVYGVDPHKEDLKIAVETGRLDDEHALPMMLQDIPKEIRDKFEVAAVLNLKMPQSEYDGFFKALYDSLPANGELVMTVAEDEILRYMSPKLNVFFDVSSQRLWGDNAHDYPHKNLVICKKRPNTER